MSQKIWIIPFWLVQNELVCRVIELLKEKAESTHEEFSRKCADFIAGTHEEFDRRQASGLPTYPAWFVPGFCPKPICSDERLVVHGRDDIAEAAGFAFNVSLMGEPEIRFPDGW